MKLWTQIRANVESLIGKPRAKKSVDLSDAEVLQLVRESFAADASFAVKFDEPDFLQIVKTHAVLEAYLRGEATPEEVRPHLKCEQCRNIAQICREILPALADEQFQKSGQTAASSRSSDKFVNLNSSKTRLRRRLFSMRQLRPALVGLSGGFFAVALALIFLWLWLPNSRAFWRYGAEPIRVVTEQGAFARRLDELIETGKIGKYSPPTVAELSALKDAADLLVIGLRTNNKNLLAEANKAAHAGGYRIVEFQNEDEQNFLVLTERQDAAKGRGMFVFRQDDFNDKRIFVTASHAVSDDRSANLAYETFRRLPGAGTLFLGGADARQHDESNVAQTVFNSVLSAALKPNSICLAIHGYDKNRPGRENYPPIIITSGAIGAPYNRILHQSLGEELRKFTAVELYDGNRFFDLAATINRQAIAAASADSIYAHLEINQDLRGDESAQEKIVAALENVLRDASPAAVARFAEPTSSEGFVSVSQVVRLGREDLLKYGNQTVLVNKSVLERLQIKENGLVVVSHGNNRAVVHLRSSPQAAEAQILIGGTVRRILNLENNSAKIQISHLP